MRDFIKLKAHLTREEAIAQGQGHLWAGNDRADRLANWLAGGGSESLLEGRGEKAGDVPSYPRAPCRDGQ